MTSGRSTMVAIVGGGASGVILAAHLLEADAASLRVVLIEKSGVYGEGIAYSTALPDHVLNVSSYGMSALVEEPRHFHDWLIANGELAKEASPIYAERRLYGRYLKDLLASLVERHGPSGRLRLVDETCMGLARTGTGVEIRLENGTSIAAHHAVLATGHDEETRAEHAEAVRPGSSADTALGEDASVLILGTGLSMVDTWQTLRASGHRGPIIAMSRRGLIPQSHDETRPVRLDRADIPLGTDLSYFFKWLKGVLREAEKRGHCWRDVIDGLRPFNQSIWQSWSARARQRFLEHTKPWWDVHRHRLAPAVHRRLEEAVDTRELGIIAGRASHIETKPSGYRVHYRPRGEWRLVDFEVDRVYDCTGIVRDVRESTNPLIRNLVEQGQIRPDPLRLGIDVDRHCTVRQADGGLCDNLFAIGPLTRGAFFEIEAIPDIRAQCKGLAQRLADTTRRVEKRVS